MTAAAGPAATARAWSRVHWSRASARDLVLRWEHLLPVVFLTAVAALSFRRYFYAPGYPAGWDVFSIILPTEFQSLGGRALSIYEDTSLGQSLPLTFGNLLAFMASQVGMTDALLKAAFALNLWLLPVGMYCLAYHWSQHRPLAVLAGLIYFLSPQAISKVADGQYFLSLAMATFPFLMLLADSCLNRPTAPRAVGLAALMAFLLLLRGDPVAYGGIAILTLAAWRLAFPAPGKTRLGQARDTLLTSAIAAPVFVALTATFWLPLATVGSPLADKAFSTETLRTTTLGLSRTLHGHSMIYSYFFWDGLFGWATHAFLPAQVFPIFTYLVPLLATAGFVTGVRDRGLAFLGVLALVSTALALGPRWPMTPVYTLLLDRLPFMRWLHEPNRFLMLTWMAYAYGAAWAAVRLAGLSTGLHLKSRAAGIAGRCLGRHGVSWWLGPGLLLAPWFLAVSPALIYGYRVWQPEEWVSQAYAWIEETAGQDEKVMAVPFGYVRSFVPGGWLQHDPGQVGSALHHRRTLRYVDEPSREGLLSRYLAYSLGTGDTGGFAKLAGSAGVRYVVAQAYPPTQPAPNETLLGVLPQDQRWTYWQQDAISKTEGLAPVWVGENPHAHVEAGASWEGGSFAEKPGPPGRAEVEIERAPVVYENAEWVPQVSVVPRAVLLVGDFDALALLARRNDFSFRDTVLVSAQDIARSGGLGALRYWLEVSSGLLLVNADMTGIAVELSGGIAPSFLRLTEKTGWKQTQPNEQGNWSAGQPTALMATERGNLPLTFDIPRMTAGELEVWLDVKYSSRPGTLTLQYGEQQFQVTPWTAGAPGFEWTRAGTLPLSVGQPRILKMSLTAGPSPLGTGVVVRRILLVPRGAVEGNLKALEDLLESVGMEVAGYGESGALDRRSRRIDSPAQLRLVKRVLDAQEAKLWTTAIEGVDVKLTSAQDIEGPLVSIGASRAPRDSPILAQVELPAPQDWSQAQFLSFWVKGAGSVHTLNFYVYFAGPGVNRVAITWRDTSQDWRQVVLPLTNPNLAEGKVDWRNVRRIVLDNPTRRLSGTVTLSGFRLLRLPETATELMLPKGMYDVRVRALLEPGGGRLAVATDADEHSFSTDLMDNISYVPLEQSGPMEWLNPLPNALTLSESVATIYGETLRAVSVQRDQASDGAALLSARFAAAQDWSQQQYLSFFVKGTGSTKTMNLYLYSQPLPNNRAIFSFNDSTTEWRQVLLPLGRPNKTEGTPNLGRVDRFVIDLPDREVTGALQFAGFSLVSQSIESADTVLSKRIAVDNGMKITSQGAPTTYYLEFLPAGRESLVAAFPQNDSPPRLDYVRISPTEYRATVQAPYGGFVVLQDAYSEQWRLETAGHEVFPAPGNFIVNVFPLDEAFSGTVRILWKGESLKPFYLGLPAAGLVFAAALVVSTSVWRRRRPPITRTRVAATPIAVSK